MKFVRFFLIALGVLLVLGGVAIGLALTPGVQRWALLRATRDVPGLRLDVGRVSAGLSGVVLEGVQAGQQDVKVKFDRLEADFSVWTYLASDRLEIRRLMASGLEVDASRLQGEEAPPATAPVAAPGLLAKVQLPFDLVLDDVQIAGRALLPGAAGQPPLDATFTLKGGKFAPGREGQLQLDATMRNPAADAAVALLRAQAGLRATLTPQRTFDRVTLTTVVDPEGPALTGKSQLKVSAELFRGSAGENYEVAVDTLLNGATENVLKLQAQLPAGSREYAGNWEVRARTAQLELFSLGLKLPDFDVKGSGRFAFSDTAASASLQGSLQGTLRQLETFDPAWRELGTLRVDATFDGSQREGVLALTQLKASVAAAQPVFDVSLLAPVRYDLEKKQLLASNGGGAEDLLRVNVAGVPVDWLRPFLTGLEVSGGAITGKFDVARVAGPVTAAAVRGEARVEGLNLSENGRPWLRQAEITLRTEATLTENLIEAPVLVVGVKTGEGDTLNLNGKFSTRTDDNPPLTLAAKFDASSAKLLAPWLPGAPVVAQGEIDASLLGQQLDVRSARLQAQQGVGKPLATLAALQPFRVDLTTHAVSPAEGAKPVARVELGRIPLGVLPVTAPDAVLGGFVQQGEFEVGMQGGKIAVRSLKPLRLGEVSLTQHRQPALSGLAIEASPSLEYTGPENFRFQSGDLTVRAGTQPLLTLKAEATGGPGQEVQGNLTFTLEVPVLATQPIFADAQAVSAGRATGEVRAIFGAQQQIESRLTLNGLVIAESGQTLPVANIGFRGLVQANGALSVQVPILLDNAGRRSDLNVALAMSPLGTGYSVDGKVTGQQVELQDVFGVLGVFSAAAAPEGAQKPAAATASTNPDTVAAWSRYSGQVVLDLKSATHGPDWAMTGLTGTVAIEPARLALDSLAASFSETSRLAAKIEMRFTGGAMPYRLTGEYSLNDFDAGKFFKAVDPGKPPTLDGLFSVSGKLAGNGETTARAINRANGDFQLTSRQGIFRGLHRTSEKLSMASKAVDFLGSVLNKQLGKAAEKVAGSAVVVDQIAQELAELRYDLLSVKLTRDELLNMNLEDISLVSQEIRFGGRGEVSYVEGKPLLEQPLNASLNLAVRGKVAELFDKLNFIDGTKDQLGYSRVRETVTLGGTLGRPDPRAFFTRLAAAKLSEMLAPEN